MPKKFAGTRKGWKRMIKANTGWTLNHKSGAKYEATKLAAFTRKGVRLVVFHYATRP